MEQMLRRLTLLLACLGTVVPGSVALYSWNARQSAQEAVTFFSSKLIEFASACEQAPGSISCQGVSKTQTHFDDAIAARDAHDERLSNCMVAVLVTAPLIFFVFYAGRWVVTGERPWVRSTKTRTTS